MRLVCQQVKQNLKSLEIQKEALLSSITEQQAQAEQAGSVFYEKEMDLTRARIEQDQKKLNEDYQGYKEDCANEYLNLMAECAQQVQDSLTEYKGLEKEIAEQRKIIDAMIEANKLLEKEKNEKDFHRCVISKIDKEEIARIRSIAPFLRNPEPLNKIIWKSYYERPCAEMIGRVLGPNIRTGIYKITHIDSGKCYVGQALDVASRFRQHIKRGIGAETPTRNKLYPAMFTYGVENFTFELLEECEPAQLNDFEDRWQEIYHAQDFGFSIK